MYYNILLPRGRPVKQLPVAHKKSQSPGASGRTSVERTPYISVALHSLKSEKSCRVDSLATEHFLFAHPITRVFLYLLLNTFILHGYLPADFMKTTDRTRDTNDKNIYRPFALVTAASKLFQICILKILETYLLTHDHHLYIYIYIYIC